VWNAARIRVFQKSLGSLSNSDVLGAAFYG
jgi:hypothetical protein